MADLNDALDWYCALAFNAGSEWSFDDINQTSPPIDTQNIVSGTNRYKVGAFTEKIINLIKLEILDSNGVGQFLIPETFNSLGSIYPGNASGQLYPFSSQTFQERYLNAPSGVPTNYIKHGDFIYLWPKPNYSIASGLKAYFNRPAIRFSFIAISSINTGTETITAASAHGLSAGDTVIFETDGTIPTGLTADTQYYVISAGLTTTDFRVSTTSGGSAVDITNAQTSSNHAFLRTNGEPGIPLMHHQALCRKAALTYLSYINSPKLGFLPAQVLSDERVISEYFSERGKDIRPRMVAQFQDNR